MSTQDVNAPIVAPAGDPCPACGGPMAGDQRYCLSCGARRAEARLPFRTILAEPVPGPAPAALAERSAPALTFLVGLGCLLLALGVGVLIGRSGGSDRQAAASTAAPQVITVGSGGAAGATTTTPAATTPAAKGSGSASSKGSKATNASLQKLDKLSPSDYQKQSQKLPKQVGTGGKAPPVDTSKPAGGGTGFQDIG
jgi:hypothetical protein